MCTTCVKGIKEPAHSQTCYFFLASPLTLQPGRKRLLIRAGATVPFAESPAKGPDLSSSGVGKAGVPSLATARRPLYCACFASRARLARSTWGGGGARPPAQRSPFPPLFIMCAKVGAHKGRYPLARYRNRFPPPPKSALFLALVHCSFLASRPGAPLSPCLRSFRHPCNPLPLPPPP